jgi:hypothetical protein
VILHRLLKHLDVAKVSLGKLLQILRGNALVLSAKALVGAYWMQFKEGVNDVDAMTVNTRLKHLGHGVGNITRAFEALKAERPSPIVQTRKEGNTKQARKKFKVTNEGKKRVEGMLANAS